jgi:hypothetical protein
MLNLAAFAQGAARIVQVTVLDENGAAVPQATANVESCGAVPALVSTDYAGRAKFKATGDRCRLRVQKTGFYQTEQDETGEQPVRILLTHVPVVVQMVDVSASAPGIDPQQVSDKATMAVPEIVNVPYPTSRDIRNLLPFYPGVVQDQNGQVHVAGSETWATLDLLDGFDIRSPMSGNLAMRFSADAVRSIDQEATRYPVRYGRNTGGVIAFYTGMGDNRFRFNATNFIPSFHDVNGLRFDKFVPRFTFSGPLVRDKAWFFDGLELELDEIYVQQLANGQNTNNIERGSNLFRVQWNTGRHNTFTPGLLLNGYHSPYDGLSFLTPQQSTTKRNTSAWLPYARDQYTFANGTLLDLGAAVAAFRDAYEPHAGGPYALTPELSQGAYFEDLRSRSQRAEGNAILYLPTRRWRGQHDLQAGVDLDHISFSEHTRRAPVNYLREDRTLLRQSTFPQFAPNTRYNVETGAYFQDRWTLPNGFLLEPGLRFDWDEIIRRPLWAPRVAAVWAPHAASGWTKISAGVGLYYEHTQLEYLARAQSGVRFDTYYAADGATAIGPSLESIFVYDQNKLKEPRALNWSVGLEQRLPADVYLKANFIRKRVSDLFAYANTTAPGALFGSYVLTNAREDHDTLAEVEARRTFKGNYSLFGAYTWSRARTNAAIDYFPAISYLGLQQPGPLPWDAPHRVISWGWLPFDVPWFRKSWDFVYTLDWRTGFPYTAVNANRQVVGPANGQRFPSYASFNPGLEWRFHFHGTYFGLRGIVENASGAANPYLVNNVVDSPQFGTFSYPAGRSLTARIRVIESKR